jgi:hypothetical protein
MIFEYCCILFDVRNPLVDIHVFDGVAGSEVAHLKRAGLLVEEELLRNAAVVVSPVDDHSENLVSCDVELSSVDEEIF